jgi:hypothetical protein
MMFWLIGLAMAQAPAPAAPAAPAAAPLPPITQAQLEDIDDWEKRARLIFDGPDTCVQLQGTATYELVFFSPGGWLGPGEQHEAGVSGTFDGTLDHGEWTQMDLVWEQSEMVEATQTPTMEGRMSEALRKKTQIHPMVGHLSKALRKKLKESRGRDRLGARKKDAAAQSGHEAIGEIDSIIKAIDPEITMAFAGWDEATGSVVLQQMVPIEEHAGGELQVRTTFPNGGVPTALDAYFPGRMTKTVGPFKLTVLNAQLHIRGQDTAMGVLPGHESVSFVIGLLGFTIGLERQIQYTRVRPCAGANTAD